ncbi:tyrosine--tRNA ligase [Candidatus Saccharibacteria bacterium]|nr:tyrosine--tRNA ligase [Candidatus Saccharibacteria bacterium]
MKLSEELIYRGFKAETTIENPEDLDNRENKKFYWGADPSADSLTIGNLAALMMCACFVRHGWTPFLLVGGATGQIGDPKDNGERDLKTLDEVDHNKNCIREQVEQVMLNGSCQALSSPASQALRGSPSAPVTRSDIHLTMVDNYDWFKDMRFLPFLREVGKNFSMTQLLDRQFVQNRIGEGGSGISYAEFSYTLIQGYDFLHLFRAHDVRMQLCGADQYGNCTTGMHLIKRLEGAEVDVWSTPLVIDPVTGRKFGKSEGNAIWLASTDNGGGNYTSIFDFYQFWLGQPDEAVEYLIKIYTLLEKDEIDDILKRHFEAPEKRIAQRALARGATEVVHGKAAAEAIESLTLRLFDKTTDFSEFAEDELVEMAAYLPVVARGALLVDILVGTGLAESKKKAREFIAQGAITVNGVKITEEITINQTAIVKKGKNKLAIVK